MTIQTINVGSYSNDGTGDDLRSAFQKVNANFAALSNEVTIADGSNLGSGVGVFAQRNAANLEFKSLTSLDESVEITSTSTTVNLKASASISQDANPTLGGNLNLNDHYVYGGDVQTTVHGLDVPTMFGVFSLLLNTNQVNLELGTFGYPSAGNIDMNGTGNINFLDSALNGTEIDFGTFE